MRTYIERLVVEEVEHVLDRQRQAASTVVGGEDGFEEIIDELL